MIFLVLVIDIFVSGWCLLLSLSWSRFIIILPCCRIVQRLGEVKPSFFIAFNSAWFLRKSYSISVLALFFQLCLAASLYVSLSNWLRPFPIIVLTLFFQLCLAAALYVSLSNWLRSFSLCVHSFDFASWLLDCSILYLLLPFLSILFHYLNAFISCVCFIFLLSSRYFFFLAVFVF